MTYKLFFTNFRLKDAEQFEKVYKEVESKYQRGEKALKADVESLQKVKKVLIDEKKHIRFGEWNAFDIEVFFFYFKYFAVLWIRIVPDPNFFAISGFAFCFIQKTVVEKK